MKDKYLYLILAVMIPVVTVMTISNVRSYLVEEKAMNEYENKLIEVNVLPVNKDKELVKPDEVRQYVLEMARREKLNVAMVDHIADCESDWIYNAKSRTGKYQGLWQISSIHNLGEDRLDVVKSTRWSLDKMKREGYGAWECSVI